MITIAVIGKNFGDEGKGLACASLSQRYKNTLIIRHNGGGQAGHTVENQDGMRFIHHQIGSGAEYGAATLLASTFLADLFQLGKELQEFQDLFGFKPVIYAERDTGITVIDDVLRNMFIESLRGDKRHGSCGMGINECINRHECGFKLTVAEVQNLSAKELLDKLQVFRREYGQKNIETMKADFELVRPGESCEYYDMLMDEDVLANFAQAIKEVAKEITIVDATSDWLSEFEQVVFETGQGLLLDNDYKRYAPHLTPSKTGLYNVARFLEKRDLALDEVIYVTRCYVTRHGNGPLPCEVDKAEIAGVEEDLTNIHNEWQGTIRYARHESLEAFAEPVKEDVKSVEACYCMKGTTISLLLTHLNETGDNVCFLDGDLKADELVKILKSEYGFGNVYESHSRYGMD